MPCLEERVLARGWGESVSSAEASCWESFTQQRLIVHGNILAALPLHGQDLIQGLKVVFLVIMRFIKGSPYSKGDLVFSGASLSPSFFNYKYQGTVDS